MTQEPITRRRWLLGQGAWLLAPAASAMHREQRQLFGGPVTLWTPSSTPPSVRAAVLALLGSMHRRWNAWKPGDVADVNAAFRVGRSIRANPALVALVRGAARLEVLSDGHFNAAIGALVGDWGFHADRLLPGPPPSRRWPGPPPSLSSVRVSDLTLRCGDPRVQLDFGGYAKGVALDQALSLLARAGVRDALLDLGGNLAAMGRSADGPWQVGVRDPFGPGLAAWLRIEGREAVVTSGVYERWREVGGRRVSHLIDPATAQPVSALTSVTVVHRDAALADAAATALLVAGPQRWPVVAARLGISQVLVIDPEGRQTASPALSARLQRA